MKQLSIIYLIICSILVFGVILISISPGQAQEIGWARGEVDTPGWPFRFDLPNPQTGGFPGSYTSRLILLGSNPSQGMIPVEMNPPHLIGSPGLTVISSGTSGTPGTEEIIAFLTRFFNPLIKLISIPEVPRVMMYKNIYRNIDLKVRRHQGEIEYNWIVNPGGNPGDIHFTYEKVKNTFIDNKGNLVIETKFGKVIHKPPVSFQLIDGKKAEIKSDFHEMSTHTFGFKVETYDRQSELFIEPRAFLSYVYAKGRGEGGG